MILPTSNLLFRDTILEQMSILTIWKKNGITSWSEESSKAFAEIASGETERSKEDPLYDTAGPWDYGDQYYPEHVLRYYHS